MNVIQLNRIFARAMYGMVIVAMVFSAAGSAYAQESNPFSGRDEFDGALAEGWDWVNENVNNWGFNNGFLRISASPYGTGGENLLLRPVAAGDFMIKTHLLFEPDTNFQFAGLVIWQDEYNFLQFGHAFCDVEDACVGNGLYFDRAEGGDPAGGNFATPIDNPSDVYLRLERRGNMVRAFYSMDEGISWYEIGIHWIPDDFQVNGVGLTASQDFYTPEWDIPADFDFFELTEGRGFLPEGFHDFDEGDVPSWACNAGGWAADPDDRGADVNIEVVVDDQTVANLVAGEFRQDLLEAEVCVDGNCSFSTSLWDVVSSYEPHRVDIWAQDTWTGEYALLSNSAKTLTCRTYDIYAYDPLTGETNQFTNLRETDEYDPTWSQNGKMIAHDVVSGDTHGIYITDVKTGVSAPLVGAQDGGNDASWSPNGKWIAFDRRWHGGPNIYIVPAVGGTDITVRENAVSPSWAPNGKRIVFQDDTDGSIRTVPVDGGKGGETFITEYGTTPAWSPDGNWIAYNKNGDIWKVQVNVQGNVFGEPIQLTSGLFADGKPTWTPDSQTIIYDSGFGQDYDVWSVPATGGMPTWLTGAPVFGDYGPANARNSSTVAYASFSPDGQAPRSWLANFSYDAGTWTEGEHSYYFENTYSIPEFWTGASDPITFTVASDAPVYNGYVLLRAFALRARVGSGCPSINPLLNTEQNTRFGYGWLTDYPMTYAEALDHFNSMMVKAYWDDGMSADLQRQEIFPSTSMDFGEYTCSLTEAPPEPALRVNYGHDWVESFYEGGHTVWIRVTDGEGNLKATAELITEPKWYWDDETGFQSVDGIWFDGDGNQMENPPDIQPYDWVYAQVDNGATAQVQIGDISGMIDLANNSIGGTINASWFSDEQFVDVECFDWGSGQEPPFDNVYGGSILPNGSEPYTCSWDEWDIQPGQDVGVGYFDPDGNWVANAFNITPLWLYVDYEYPGGVEGDYELGHTVQVTVFDSEWNAKATATVETREMPHWGGAPGFGVGDSDWVESPPDIQPGDIVRAIVDDGFLTTEVRVGEITGMIDLDTNRVTGTIYAPWKGDSVNVLCSPWGAPEGVNGIETTVNPNGEDTFTCTWDSTEWDIQPGEAVGVYYWAGIGLHSIANAIPNPWIMAFPEANQIFGYGWPVGSEVSLTINDEYIATITVKGAPWDENDIMAFFDIGEEHDLVTGDVIQLSGSGMDREHTVQYLTVTDVNWEFDTVTGQAESGMEVHTWVHEFGQDVWLTAVDDTWTAYFGSDEFQLEPGMCGRAEIRVEGNNSTNVDWCIPNPEIRAWLGNQRVEGYQWPLGESISLSIDGNVFEPQQVQGDESWTYVSFEIGEWVLEPGQEIVMMGAGIEKTHIILPVSITSVDTALNLVEGTATSEGRIILCIYNGGCDPPMEVFADSSGYWQNDYGDQFDIQPGFGMDATEFDDDGDGTSFDFQIPITFFITSVQDIVDNDGICTLREAIIAANTNSPSGDVEGECPGGTDSQTDTILLVPDQTYLLTIGGPGEDDSYSGDLDIWDNSAETDLIIMVEGDGTATILQDVAVGDRVLQNHGAAVRIEGLSLTGGNEGEHGGGSILNHGSLTLINCNIFGNATVQDGGGIANSGDLVVDASTISANTAQFGGGLANWSGGTVTIQNGSLIGGDPNEGAGNTAVDDGGGSFNYGVLTMSDSTISGNSAGYGGGLANWGGEVTFSASTISGNTGDNNGGGILNKDGGTTTIQNGSTVYGNSSSNGGGIANWTGAVILTNSTVSGNSAGAGGGLDNWGTATVTNCQITSNTVTWAGGGIHNNFGGTTTINASTISENSSDVYGGGIMNWEGSTVTLTNSMITGNTTPVKGGGIGNAGNLTVENTILSANTANQGGGVYSWGVALITDGTLVEGNTAVTSSDGGGGGGLFNIGTMTAESITVTNNTAPYGGGLFNWTGGMLTISNTVVLGNSADQGGGLTTHENSTTVIQNGSLISNNTANWAGGGVNNWGMLTITGSFLYNNTSLIGVGNAINSDVNVENAMSVTESCILGNGGVAVFNSQAVDELATGNWWGDASGPSGAGPGSGDSVSDYVDFSDWLSEPPSICTP